jgi:carbonic anhydrase
MKRRKGNFHLRQSSVVWIPAFDQGLGDIFSIRIAGNILNEDILGSMEFATKVVGTKIILVLGHTKCGAIIGACNSVVLGSLTKVLEKIAPAIDAETETTINRTGSNTAFVNNVTEGNVHHVIKEIKNGSAIISELVNNNHLKIVGGIYNVDTGNVAFFEE